MTALVDDGVLGHLLRSGARSLPSAEGPIYTTGCWYVRLCQALAGPASGSLSLPFAALPPNERARAIHAVLALPDDIGLVSLRDIGPLIGQIRRRHTLNLLAAEAVAAAVHLGASVHLSNTSPPLEAALELEGVAVAIGKMAD